MPNLFRALGIAPQAIAGLDIPAIEELIKLRYRQLSMLTHADSASYNPNAGQYHNAIQEAYDDAGVDLIFDEHLTAWREKLGDSAANSPERRSLLLNKALTSQSQLAAASYHWLMRMQADDQELLKGLEQTLQQYLRRPKWLEEPVHSPDSLLLEDNLPLIAADIIRQQKPSQAQVREISAFGKAADSSVWVELRCQHKGIFELRKLYRCYHEFGRSRFLDVPDDWIFDDPQLHYRPFHLEGADKEPEFRQLQPLGCLRLGDFDDTELRCHWYQFLFKPYLDEEDLHMAVHGFPWERFVKVAPYLTPQLREKIYPLVAVDHSGAEPLFKVFSGLESYRRIE